MDGYTPYFGEGLRPEPVLTVCSWADAHRVLTDASKEAGRYRTSRTPFLKEIMETLSVSDPVTDISIMKATQIGGTEIANNFLGYIIDNAPGPTMYMLPTVDLAQDHSKNRVAPMIEACPRLKEKVAANRSRDGSNTVLTKAFRGGALYFAGSNSGASYRSKSIRFMILDDIDGFLLDIEGEGDPIELAGKRTDTYSSRKKILKISTPTIKGASLVEAEYLKSDQRKYYVPCPICGEMQVLEWGGKGAEYGIKFIVDDGVVVDCWYQCRGCHGRIDEHHKTEMLARGEWRAGHPGRDKRGYHISGFMSPAGFVSWLQIAQEFIDAKGNQSKLKVWVNTRRGLPFEESGEQPQWAVLKSRCSVYSPLMVPAGGLFLTAGVDVQENRLAVIVRAWGRGEESFLVYWGELWGDTAEKAVWEQLDGLLYRGYQGESGEIYHIASMGIDAGYRTNDVYRYVRKRDPVVIALKGQSTEARPIIGKPTYQDVTDQGMKYKNGIQLWPVGVDTAKTQIYSRLKLIEGPGAYHWFLGLDDEYFLQLSAEKSVVQFSKGFPHYEWIKTRDRNEALDAEVYALAAAYRAGMPLIDWDTFESKPREAENGGESDKRQQIQKRRRW
jgi:phage terminase large subunit GpA-like protein